MNRCTFFGELLGDAVLIHEDGSMLSEEELELGEQFAGISFSIVAKSRRANQPRRIDTSRLTCNAWGSAADVIYETIQSMVSLPAPEDKILILIKDATAKTHEGNVTFRVNDFELI